jgi:hypothetical protein
MTHGTEHHLEEAEHAQHASHDPFDRRVALTMVIVAAVLACVTLVSHRAQHETLNEQIVSSKHTTEAANQWARYQAKVIRSYMYEDRVKELPLLAKDTHSAQVEEQAQKLIEEHKAKLVGWKKDMEEISREARAHEEKAKEASRLSSHAQHQTEYFDGGELTLTMALVLCSVSMLAKRRAFWYAGMILCAIGLAISIAGLVVPDSAHEPREGEHAARTTLQRAVVRAEVQTLSS